MLEVAVFLCGAVVMVIELAGSRILAPALGTSLVVWTSLIGVILAALSLGAWWGGRLADRRPEPRRLSRIILLAAFCTAAVALTKGFVLDFLQAGNGLHLAAVAAVLALFAPPALLLGMVAPFAVRLRLLDPSRGGRTAGDLYALSTLGSIAGTFLAGFVLIAWVGSTNIILLMAAVLALAATCVHPPSWKPGLASLGLFLALLLLARAADAHLARSGFLDTDTPYGRVIVCLAREEGTGRLMRAMITGPGARQSAMYMDDPQALALPYTRFYRLTGHFVPDMDRVLVLGGGGYSFPKFALAAHPELLLDVVELDPGVTALAREHFGLRDDPRLRVLEEDARIFLNRNGERYDAILCDVFNTDHAVPFHLTTVETVRRLRASLTDNGVVLVNLLSSMSGDRGRLYRALFATYAAVFPRVRAYAVEDPAAPGLWQNVILAAFSDPETADRPSADPELAAMLAARVPDPETDLPVLTDAYAPVDRYAGRPPRLSGFDSPAPGN